MREANYRGWIFECDAEATRQAYGNSPLGGAEECGCRTCRNFVAARPEIYPVEVLQLFNRLGVDPQREVEVYHLGRLDSGLHLYGGWLHFIGRILKQPDAPEKLNDHFTIDFLEKSDLAADVLRNHPLVQIELTMEIPWMLKSEKELE
jgi:hypothetical protein